MNRLKGKYGSSLVEVIVAVALLAIVVVTVVGGIGLARQSVTDNNVKDDNTAVAQNITDTLLTYLSSLPADQTKGKPDETDMQNITKALLVDDKTKFSSSASNTKQFYYAYANADGTAGYKIEVRVYYNKNSEKYSTFTAFAACTGGEFQ